MDHSESAYIVQQRQKEAEYRQAQADIDTVVRKFRSLAPDQLPPLWMMQKIGSHSAEHFKDTSSWTFVELLRRGRLRTSSTVLDIGSGCGRLALPFSQLIRTGRYLGTDVFEEGVRWCNENISRDNPCFSFHLQRVQNNYYFGGDIKPSDSLSLGFADTGSIDFAFAISVFTHLVEQDAQRYLDELRRCMRDDGLAYLTCFIIDDAFHDYVRRTGKHQAVKKVSDGHYQAYANQDFFAGYDFSRWQAMVEQAGLRIYGYDPGMWAEKPGALHYQDIFLIRRK